MADSHIDQAMQAKLRALSTRQMHTLLTNYYRRLRGRYKVPTFSGQELDMHRLFWTVIDKGGYYVVSQSKLWKEVCRGLGVDLKGQTSASYNMRLNYEKCLLEFERYCASGQYAADLAQNTAPSYEAVTEPQRHVTMEPRPGLKRERSLAPDSSGALILDPPLAKHPRLFEAAKPAANVTTPQEDDTGFTGSFIEVLAQAGVLPLAPDGGSTLGPSQRSPVRAPWLRTVGPCGVPAQHPTMDGKVTWVPPVAIPAAAYGTEHMFQRQAPLPEPLGALLQRRGAQALKFRVIRLLTASNQWVAATLIDYNAATGCHCLRYDPSAQAAPAGIEWALLGALPDSVLRCHPANPLPGFLTAPVSKRTAIDVATVPDDAMRGIINALLVGVSPAALKQMVDVAVETLGIDSDDQTDALTEGVLTASPSSSVAAPAAHGMPRDAGPAPKTVGPGQKPVAHGQKAGGAASKQAQPGAKPTKTKKAAPTRPASASAKQPVAPVGNAVTSTLPSGQGKAQQPAAAASGNKAQGKDGAAQQLTVAAGAPTAGAHQLSNMASEVKAAPVNRAGPAPSLCQLVNPVTNAAATTASAVAGATAATATPRPAVAAEASAAAPALLQQVKGSKEAAASMSTSPPTMPQHQQKQQQCETPVQQAPLQAAGTAAAAAQPQASAGWEAGSQQEPAQQPQQHPAAQLQTVNVTGQQPTTFPQPAVQGEPQFLQSSLSPTGWPGSSFTEQLVEQLQLTQQEAHRQQRGGSMLGSPATYLAAAAKQPSFDPQHPIDPQHRQHPQHAGTVSTGPLHLASSAYAAAALLHDHVLSNSGHYIGSQQGNGGGNMPQAGRTAQQLVYQVGEQLVYGDEQMRQGSTLQADHGNLPQVYNSGHMQVPLTSHMSSGMVPMNQPDAPRQAAESLQAAYLTMLPDDVLR